MSGKTKKVAAAAESGKPLPRKKSARKGSFLSHVNASMRAKAGPIIMMLYQKADNGKLSGRADGNVYMRNGRVRGMTVPALVQNSYTSSARVRVATLSQGWEALTEAERLTWNNLEFLFKSDRFGNPKQVKGKAAYVMLNTNLLDVGATPITIAPVASEGVGAFTDATVVTDISLGTTVISAFTPDPVDADTDFKIFATAQKSAGTYRPGNSAFRLIGGIPATTAAPYDMTALWEDKFGDISTLVAGKKIFFKFVPINNTTGVEGGNLVVQSIIVA